MRLRTAFLAVFAALAVAAPAQADTYTVTNGSSDSTAACTGTSCPSLRAAIAAAALSRPVDTINVPAGTINVTSDLVVGTSLTIVGTSAGTNVIDGGAKSRGLRVTSGAVVTLSHFTIRNGAANEGGSNDGGGVLNTGGQLTLDSVHITASRAARGGGVANTYAGSVGGTTAITHSLIDANTATSTGGGVANLGPAETSPITYVALSDSTVFANTASAGGTGGIAAVNVGGLLALARTTVADNVGGTGAPAGGLAVTVAARAQVTGSIVARNRIGAATVNCGAVKPTDGGSDVEDDTDCAFNGGGLDPRLAAALTSEGGEVQVLALASGSPAVDRLPVAANCTAGMLDQRGLYRPQGAACDAGAYELDAPSTFTITAGPTGTINTDSAQFDFSSSDPTAAPVCQLTGPGQTGGFVTCYKSNAALYTGLGNGAYTFSVRDAAFATGPVTSRGFTVAALDSTITGGPSGPTNDTTPTFTFTGANGAASFQCRVDAAAFATCATPFTTAALAVGAHTFQVRALSATGAPESTPASRAFSIDVTPPDTTITSGPTGTVASTTAAFTATSTEGGSTFQCQLDGGRVCRLSRQLHGPVPGRAHGQHPCRRPGRQRRSVAGHAQLDRRHRRARHDAHADRLPDQRHDANVRVRVQRRRLDVPVPRRRRSLRVVHVALHHRRPSAGQS